MTTTPTTQIQDIWFKTQRVLRTLVQVGIPAFLAFALVLPQILEASGIPVTSSIYIWLLSVAGGVTAVATGLSRIMAIPAVNLWLVKIGLGSVPKSAIDKNLSATATDMSIETLPRAGTPPAIGNDDAVAKAQTSAAEYDPTPADAEYEPKHAE